MSYRVFTRAWWRREGGKIVPNPGARKLTLGYVATEEEARAMCRAWNNNHKPDWRSVKAEYMDG